MRSYGDGHLEQSVSRKRRERRYGRVVGRLLEALEPRQMLAADLSGSFLLAPTSVLSGASQSVTVNVVNGGTQAKGTITVAFYAQLDGVAFDASTARLLGTASKGISLATGGSTNVSKTLTISPALAAGSYRLYAVIDATNKIAEGDETNNLATSAPVAVAQPNYDLVGAFGAGTTLLPAVLAGQTTNQTVKVVVMNSSGGTATLPAGQKVAVQVVARPVGAGDASQDVVLNRSVVNVAVGGLAPGKSRTVSMGIQYPATLADGAYEIVAKVDTGGALAETNEANNEALFSHNVTVAPAFSDPALAFDPAAVIPAAVVADGRKLPLKFDVENLGNVSIAGGQTTQVTLVAHNVGTSVDTPLGVFAVNLSGLGSGKSKAFTLSPTVPLSLANGSYVIQATLATTATGDIGGNNAVTSATAMSVGPAFFNLATQAPTSTFNPALLAGRAATGTVSVGVKNLSNTVIPPGTLVNVTVVMRPVGVVGSGSDIAIGSGANMSISNLGMGATRTLKVNAQVPATLPNGDPVPVGDYVLVATVTPVVLGETTLSDNTAAGSVVTVAAPFVDLAITSATQNFPSPSASGSGGAGTVTLRNMGNVAIQSNVTIQFFAVRDGTSQPFFIGARTFTVSLEPGATSAPLDQALVLNVPADGLLSAGVEIFARIDPASVADTNALNNQRSAGSVVLSSQYVDLVVGAATNPFGGTANGGATGTGNVLIGNIGSGFASGVVTITYYASVSGALDGSEVVIGTQAVTVALNQAQLTPLVPVALTLPNPGVTTVYKILATITSSLTLDNNAGDNVTPVLGSVTVVGAV